MKIALKNRNFVIDKDKKLTKIYDNVILINKYLIRFNFVSLSTITKISVQNYYLNRQLQSVSLIPL